MATFVDIALPRPPAQPFFSQRTVLGGRELYFEFNWNGRSSRWFLSVFDASERPIVVGLKLVTGAVLTRRLKDPRFPNNGDLMLVGAVPTLESLGDGSHSLVFVDYTK